MNEHFSQEKPHYTESAEKLNLMQQEANDGRGISAIRDIALYLQRGEIDAAKTTISSEWDKISSYPEIADYLISEGLYTPLDFTKYFDD